MVMEQIPIHEGKPFDNVVHLPGGTEPDDEPETADRSWLPPMEPAIGALFGEGARIIGGFISATSSAITTALREMAPPPEPTDDEDGFDEVPRTGPSPVGVATGAAIGLTMQVSDAAVRAATSFAADGRAVPLVDDQQLDRPTPDGATSRRGQKR